MKGGREKGTELEWEGDKKQGQMMRIYMEEEKLRKKNKTKSALVAQASCRADGKR